MKTLFNIVSILCMLLCFASVWTLSMDKVDCNNCNNCNNYCETMSSNNLCITAWNSRGLRAAQPYLRKLASLSDIVIISEHNLYESQLFKLNDISKEFISYGKSAGNLDPNHIGFIPGHGGVAVMWKKDISCKVKPLRNLGSDRICTIELLTEASSVFIVGVYLPHANCRIADYQYHLDVLEHVIEQCSIDGDVIVMGDFNAHFGQDEQCPRGWGKTSPSGKKLMDMCHRRAMTPVDMNVSCKGPRRTFENERGHVSYVDHCIVSNHCVQNICSCQVLDDILNTSDHLAVTCTLELRSILSREVTNSPVADPRVAWHKMSKPEIKFKYSEALDAKLACSPLLTGEGCLASDIRDNIKRDVRHLECAIKDISRNLPVTKYSKHLKPYWNRGLTESVARKKSAWRRWVAAGRLRGNDPIWLEYKGAKKQFRKEQRVAALAYETKYLDDVSKTQEIDQRSFWQLINKRRKQRNNQPRPVVDKEGKTIRDFDNIVRVWGEYYGDLYTPESGQYNHEFENFIDREIKDTDMNPREDSDILSTPITSAEVEETCRSLRLGKAPGLDGIQTEHLKFAGPTTYSYLAILFNSMTEAEWRPLSMKKGIIVPIPKGNKDATLPDNNRGITLRSVLGKVYDKLLLKRSDSWFLSIMHDEQGANRTGCSSVNTALILKENVCYHLGRGKPVYVALLDTRKAFDTVWQNGLFFKLRKYEMDSKLWRILKNVYDDFQCAVNIGGKLSNWFHPKQGVHQGDVFSMKLYGVFNDELIKDLAESGNGTMIGSISCGNPTFADDIAVATLSKMNLNNQLNIAYLYSCKWRFNFNVKKTQCLVFGRDKRPDMPIKLGREVIKVTDRGIHLGTQMYSKPKLEDICIGERITGCRKSFFALEGVGSGGRGFDPTTFSKLYWAICVPKMLYGFEVNSFSAENMERMEKIHSDLGRKIQRLPPLSARPTNYALLGWRCIKAYVDIHRLLFLFRILLMPSSMLCWKVTINRWTECRFTEKAFSSPIATLYETASRYGLDADINYYLDSGEMPSKDTWKRKVKSIVDGVYLQRWTVECHMYSSLKVFVEIVSQIELNVWWVVCKKNPQLKRSCSTMVKLITGNHNLSSGRRQYVYKSRICQICNGSEENIEHLLFECQRLDTRREALWSDILLAMPRAMSHQVDNMCNHDKVIFLLSGFKSYYISEWNNVYVAVLAFVGELYSLASDMRPDS